MKIEVRPNLYDICSNLIIITDYMFTNNYFEISSVFNICLKHGYFINCFVKPSPHIGKFFNANSHLQFFKDIPKL